MKYFAIHHTQVSHNTAPAQFWAIDRYHKQKFGLKSSLGYYVGYHYYIGRGGELTQTRKHTEETTAIYNHNCSGNNDCDTISVCLAGNFDIEFPTEKQIEKLQHLYKTLKLHYPDMQVVGHRDLQENRTCPGALIGEDFYRMIEDKKEEEESEIKKLYWELPFWKKTH